jgi:hypothetical protein
MTQEAIYVSRTDHLDYFEARFTRLYFGVEFCQNVLPEEADLKVALRFAEDHNIDFTLVTPFVTDRGLKRVGQLLEQTRRWGRPFEVVVNDFGVLRLVNSMCRDTMPPVGLGRLQTKMKRGPRLPDLGPSLPPQAVDHFMRPNADYPPYARFLQKLGVRRLELDNPVQGLVRKEALLPGSLYHPYVYVSTGRYCHFAGPDDRQRPLRKVTNCGQECLPHRFTLRNKEMPVELLLRGATLFYRNDPLPDDLAAWGVNRLVVEPDLPL